MIGPNVLRECEEKVRRKTPDSLPKLAYLFELARIVVTSEPGEEGLMAAKAIVSYEPDAFVLAEAMGADVDWLITYDKQPFLKKRKKIELSFQLGTPGDLIQSIEDHFSQGT